jgi:heat shock protein HtpX
MTIAPRRSLGVFAALAMAMVVLSYLVTIVIAISCVYIPWVLVANASNVQTVSMLVAGAVICFVLLGSLLPRRDRIGITGLLLDRAVHPRLFAEIDTIATALGEPMPDDVYLIGEPNAWVADRPGPGTSARRRILGIGLPLLAILNISEMRAVLAHEFAHFYAGDTRLAPRVYRAQAAMVRTLVSMSAVGHVMRVALMQILYVLAFRLLKWYSLIFLRAVQALTRRQESRADELACLVAGSEALVSGLTAVHRAAIAWPPYLTELAPTLNAGFLPPVAEGFALFLSASPIAKHVDERLNARLRGESAAGAYDSHPPLADRVAAARAIGSDNATVDRRPAWSLCDEHEATEPALLAALNPGKTVKTFRRLAWNDYVTQLLIPAWTQAVAEQAHVLHTVSAANLPDVVGRLGQIATQLKDQGGTLRNPQQRAARVCFLLGAALGLALIENEWSVKYQPGELVLEHGELHVNPFLLVKQLASGLWSAAEWGRQCRALGLPEGPLVVGGPGGTEFAIESPAARDSKTLGGEIRRLRTAAGLTARELAERAGMRAPYLVAIEDDREEPTAHALRRLASALEAVGASYDELAVLLRSPEFDIRGESAARPLETGHLIEAERSGAGSSSRGR